jgi:predicted nucleic-acid-binding protein
MIGLDTNILVRYVVQDDPVQSAVAAELIESMLDTEEPGFVSVVVLAEFAWVLERTYGFSGSDIAAAIERVLQTDALVVQSEQAAFTAMTAAKRRHGSFADALIGALAAEAGCERTFTFDRRALRLPGFEHP